MKGSGLGLKENNTFWVPVGHLCSHLHASAGGLCAPRPVIALPSAF